MTCGEVAKGFLAIDSKYIFAEIWRSGQMIYEGELVNVPKSIYNTFKCQYRVDDLSHTIVMNVIGG